ncbi:IucA/IucC family protein [Saccharomonospora sp. NPDC046836]|uniref:IucA/IucC family protein n=1 Tax=Saccharomonospora sp. NPDC046836 TaxID=3156921 RepID=UPI003401277A
MSALAAAQRAARQRLLNAYLRETGVHDVPLGELPILLPATGQTVIVQVCHRSPFGHHAYADVTVPGHEDLIRALLAELEATTGYPGAAELTGAIRNSVDRTARYLAHGRPAPAITPHAITRRAEQNVLFGHPFHPTPKSAEGFADNDLDRYAPELGAQFVPHYFAVAGELVAEVRVTPGPWVPDEVATSIPDGYAALPAHPWQAAHLLRRPAVTALVREGGLVPLGPLGRPVYPTSSVRTVCDPQFPTAWKLPLHVRVTNFIRNNPSEQLRRATDASLLAGHLPAHPGFGVLRETGYRTVDPRVVGAELAAELAVLYRENPFVHNGSSPRVLAGLLDDPAELIHCVQQAGDVLEWLRRYLHIALRPLLAVFASDGMSFEAHVQNSLLCTDGGWPVQFWVRDLEGAAVSRTRLAHDLLAAHSPALYDDAEAWLRLQYHAVTNQLGHVIHVLGRYTTAGEEKLWAVAREVASSWPEAAELLAAPVLPAKANLISRFAGHGERPLYVDVPNPLRELP